MITNRDRPSDIFCPACQPDLPHYRQFPQSAARNMGQAAYSVGLSGSSLVYACDGCCEVSMATSNGVWHVRPLQNGRPITSFSREYAEYFRMVFGDFEIDKSRN